MAELFKMPRLGQSMEEGTVLRWFKQEGDTVRTGEPLLEVMSDKANFEVESTLDGVLRKILVQADGTVPVNEAIAIIGASDEPIEDLFARGTAVTAVSNVAETVHPQTVSAVAPGVRAHGKTAISPRARRMADAKGIPVSALATFGTGPDGRVLERDVVAYVERAAALVDEPRPDTLKPRTTPLAARLADDLGVNLGDLSLGLPGSRVTADVVRRHAKTGSSAGDPAVSEVIPLRGLRKIIADNVTKSRQTAPHVTLTLEVDMTGIVAQFAQLRAEVEKRDGVKPTYTDILIKASARAIADFPLANAALVGDEIRVYKDVNVGVAVAAPSGLVVPVVRNADNKSLVEVSAEVKGLVERCRAGKQTGEDLSGGTFTITNLGAYGIDVFDPIIVSPQSCILGVGRIAEKPVVASGTVVVRAMMNLCLSFDHRVMDGAPAAQFLRRIKELLETPLLVFI